MSRTWPTLFARRTIDSLAAAPGPERTTPALAASRRAGTDEASVAELGVTRNVDGADAVQLAPTGSPVACRRPRWMVAGCPTAMVALPLGRVKPRAGNRPVP